MSRPAAQDPYEDDPTDEVDSAPARRWGLTIGAACTFIALDQLSKWWAVRALSGGPVHLVWTLQLNLTGNTGASFSRFGGQGPLISLGAVAVVCAMLWLSPSGGSRPAAISLGMILGGALGNLVDRALRGNAGFLHGPVVDFIDLQWWPIFNVADMSVVTGAIVLALSYLGRPAEDPRTPRGHGDSRPDG